MCVLVFYDFPFLCPPPPAPPICIFVILCGVSEILVSWFRPPGETAQVLDSRSENFVYAYNTPGNLRLA